MIPDQNLNDRTFRLQTEWEDGALTARCAHCGAERIMEKPWYKTRQAVFAALRRRFNYCERCGRWVCDKCFVAQGPRGAAALCARCAAEQGITGKTTAEVMRD
jgi:transcription elongation factor Elf1